MNPSLVLLAGPLKGTTVVLSREETRIGRDLSNELVIGDGALSRHHCLIAGESGTFTLRDLESLNGIFVNGLPVKERVLRDGDVIRIGDSVLLFLSKESSPPGHESGVHLETRDLELRSTIRLRREDARYLKLEYPPSDSRAVRDLKALFRITKALHGIRDVEAVREKLLELLFEVVPADTGAILIHDGEDGQVRSAAARCATAGDVPSVSRAVAREVLAERVGMLLDEGERSILCVPLTHFDETFGCVYLENRRRSSPFDEADLELVTAAGEMTGLALSNARHLEWLQDENRSLRAESDLEHSLVGESAAMKELLHLIAKVAATDSTVLVRGESGTGKELVARAIHRNSRRATEPFVAINCAALTETLLESELFGHEKGAFTGAISQKRGKLELAEGGTAFLDEVGELAPGLQAKLLRVLQEREFERVGGTRPIKVNLRVIAATNEDLEEGTRAGRFRQDLFYRLNVVPLSVPTLRERRDDLPLLASFFVKKYGAKCKRRVRGLSKEALRYLMGYDWPGNVRELENAIERAVVLGSSERILPEDLPEAVLETQPSEEESESAYHGAVKKAKKELLRQAVREAAGNYTEAARRLGVNPTYLHRLIRNLGLRDDLVK